METKNQNDVNATECVGVTETQQVRTGEDKYIEMMEEEARRQWEDEE